MNRRLGFLIVGVLAGVLSAGPARAEWVTVFREDFDGSALDASKWIVESTNGQYSVSAGSLHMRSIPTGLPGIASLGSPIPATGRLKIQFGFQFGATTCLGSALGLEARGTFLSQCPNSPPLVPTYRFHRDCAKGTNVNVHPVTDGFGSCGQELWGHSFDSNPPAYHVGEFNFASDSVYVVIDGTLFDTDTSGGPRPNTIHFGGPGDPCCNYTEYDVDFVQVQVWEEPVPARPASWGAIKHSYR